MKLSDAIAADTASRVTAAGTRMRAATVTALGDDLIDVLLGDGTALSDVRYLASWVPEVGQQCLMLTSSGQWFALGELSRPQLGAETLHMVVRDPSATVMGKNNAGSWVWTPGDPPTQGLVPLFGSIFAGVWLHGGFGLPEGASIQSAKLTVARIPWTSGGTLKPIRVYAHGYTATPSGAPSWVHGPWTPGSLLPGQSGTWELPAEWITSMESGAVTGFGIYSTAAADLLVTTADPPDGRVSIAYTVETVTYEPAEEP